MKEKKMQPHLHLSEVHEICFLSGNPDRVPKIARLLTETEQVASNRGLVAFNGKTPNKKVSISILTTGMGCPSTAIILEEAFRAGGRVFIRIGSCGALKPGINIGDIVIPYAAVRDERTSLNFAPKKVPAISSPKIFQKLCESADKLKINYYPGIVWTTDIYYSSNHDEYQKWAYYGVNSVEMESALIFIFGLLKKVKVGTILVVDGNLAEGTQKDEGNLGDINEIFQQGVENAVACAIRTVEIL
ncbi:MAG: nucleoside phosphorylase [Candidatus Thorarchaeota archaeon]